MSQEGYKPTKAEIKKAEATMTEEQKVLSEERESGENEETLLKEYESLKKESGVREGDIEHVSTQYTNDGKYRRIVGYEGNINGHKFGMEESYDRYICYVEGSSIFDGGTSIANADTSAKIWYKFLDLAKAKLKLQNYEDKITASNETLKFEEKAVDRDAYLQKIATAVKDLLGE